MWVSKGKGVWLSQYLGMYTGCSNMVLREQVLKLVVGRMHQFMNGH